MYIPPAFRIDDNQDIYEVIRRAGLASFVTATTQGLIATPVPMFLNEKEGEMGTLYSHLARANPQWKLKPTGDAMAIFMGPDVYITPSWYETKQETGRVVPTWNYVAVHAYGPAEFFDDENQLYELVSRLTNVHEANRPQPWAVTDAPPDFMKSQLKGIVGVRLPITRLEGKRKMSQNRSAKDRAGVIRGLSESADPDERAIAGLIPER
jgi:transcriptional regulator